MFRKSREAVPGKYSLAGKSIQCPHCQGTEFLAGEAQLNTALASLFELDWLNTTAAILACTACGQIQWFDWKPTKEA